MKSCAITGCIRKYYGKGYCNLHWRRTYKHGDPLIVLPKGFRHGGYGSTEYKIWEGMRSRCLTPTCRSYPKYGGRGIKICDRWAESFTNFLEDMGPRPGSEYSIERIDNDGHYEPGNCKWATDFEQAQNKRRYRTNTSGFNGVYPFHGKWQASIQRNNVRVHLGTFETKEAAKAARDNAVRAAQRLRELLSIAV